MISAFILIQVASAVGWGNAPTIHSSMMPELNGFELCELLHNNPKFSGTPIIIISAKDDPESKQKALAA